MQQFSEEEDCEHSTGEAESLKQEEGQGIDPKEELIHLLRRILQRPQAWVLLATLGGSTLAILIQTGLIWPILFVLIVGGMVFFYMTQQSTVLASVQVQEEPLAEVSQKQRVGLLAQIETLDDIQLLTGRQFEVLVADLMEHLGYTDVKVVGRSRDLGVDIKAVGLKGEQVAVQCKRYMARKKIGSGLFENDSSIFIIAMKKEFQANDMHKSRFGERECFPKETTKALSQRST